jgi:acetylornithine deacetylase/succinyl-diaminopimelate desuccinylase-like protein
LGERRCPLFLFGGCDDGGSVAAAIIATESLNDNDEENDSRDAIVDDESVDDNVFDHDGS